MYLFINAYPISNKNKFYFLISITFWNFSNIVKKTYDFNLFVGFSVRPWSFHNTLRLPWQRYYVIKIYNCIFLILYKICSINSSFTGPLKMMRLFVICMFYWYALKYFLPKRMWLIFIVHLQARTLTKKSFSLLSVCSSI